MAPFRLESNEYVSKVYYRQSTQLCGIQFETNTNRKSVPYLLDKQATRWQNSNTGPGRYWVHTATPGHKVMGYKNRLLPGEFNCPCKSLFISCNDYCIASSHKLYSIVLHHHYIIIFYAVGIHNFIEEPITSPEYAQQQQRELLKRDHEQRELQQLEQLKLAKQQHKQLQQREQEQQNDQQSCEFQHRADKLLEQKRQREAREEQEREQQHCLQKHREQLEREELQKEKERQILLQQQQLYQQQHPQKQPRRSTTGQVIGLSPPAYEELTSNPSYTSQAPPAYFPQTQEPLQIPIGTIGSGCLNSIGYDANGDAITSNYTGQINMALSTSPPTHPLSTYHHTPLPPDAAHCQPYYSHQHHQRSIGIPVDTTGDGRANATGYDTTGDGQIDSLDTTGDGIVDVVLPPSAHSPHMYC